MNSPQQDRLAIIDSLGLQPHPEGGHYREVFRSDRMLTVQGRARSAATSIYYLLARGDYSAWHRIDADETWYFHAGQVLRLHVLAPDGRIGTVRLGNPLRHDGAVFQHTVAADCWFAAELEGDAEFALVSCNVAPGFEFDGFRLASREDLASAMEQHGPWLNRLLRPASSDPA